MYRVKGTLYLNIKDKRQFVGKVKEYEKLEMKLRISHDIPKYFGFIKNVEIDDTTITIDIVRTMQDMSMELMPYYLNMNMSSLVTTCHIVKVFQVLWETVTKID